MSDLKYALSQIKVCDAIIPTRNIDLEGSEHLKNMKTMFY